MSMPHVLSSCLYLADISTVPLYKLVAMPNAFIPWWRHQMETFSALLAICAGNSPVPGEFPTQRPVTRSFDVFFDLRLNKRLSKQSWGWWFETLSRPLWRHCNDSGLWKTGIPHWWCDSPMHWRACVLTPCLEIGSLNYCPACRTTLVATRFRVAVICPINQVPHCIRVFCYFVWFVFINHIFQFHYELCTYCNILDIYLS